MAFGKQQTKEKKDSDLISVGALWPNRNGNGFSGSFTKDTAAFEEAVNTYGLAGLRFIVFENSFAKKETDPTYKIYVAPKQESKGSGKPSKKEPLEDQEAPPSPSAKKAKRPWDEE